MAFIFMKSRRVYSKQTRMCAIPFPFCVVISCSTCKQICDEHSCDVVFTFNMGGNEIKRKTKKKTGIPPGKRKAWTSPPPRANPPNPPVQPRSDLPHQPVLPEPPVHPPHPSSGQPRPEDKLDCRLRAAESGRIGIFEIFCLSSFIGIFLRR